MSELHIGPHTRDDSTTTHGPGDTHHTYDREIDLKSIIKWMAGLVLVTLICQVVVWWFIRGIERFDAKQDPELTPIQQEVRQPLPPAPRLQVAPNFQETNDLLNEGGVDQRDPRQAPDTRSDLEDMQILRETEDKVLATPSWIDQGQGRLRVPIDVAMQVIASRGAEGVGGAAGVGGGAAGTVTPQQMRQQLPAGTSPGLPGATVQMSRPQAPAQPNEQPAGAAQGQQQQSAPRPPASQEQ
jgi:hypothetical protein